MSHISIALATYNGERYLDEQLDSLEAQTRKPDDLVVCDDQSSDRTVELVERFAERASFPVHVYRNAERLGWRGNFIKASGLCSGDLIAFCDQDDLWYPDKLAVVEAEFVDPSVLLVHHNADLVDASGAAYGTLLPVARQRDVIAARSRPTHWSNPLGLTTMFRASLNRYQDLWPTTIDLAVPGSPAAHDQWFYFLATNLGTVVALPERLLAYRQHGRNAVGWDVKEDSRGRDRRHEIEAAVDRVIGMLRPFCQVLAEAAARDDPQARQLTFARERNHALLQRVLRRREVYASHGSWRRTTAFWSLIRHRDHFAADGWGLGGTALVEDATLGLFGRSASGA